MPSVDGVVSGMNTTALIDAIVAADQIPKQTLQTHLADLQSRRDKVAGLASRLDTLASTIEGWSSGGGVLASKVAVSGDTQVAAAATGKASGRWSVQVLALAQSTSLIGAGVSSRSDAIFGAGTYSVTVAGATTTLDVPAEGASLDDIAAMISTVSGARAYVLDTGSATNPYSLVVEGTETGAANGVSVDLSGVGGPAFTETSGAQDAHITIGGVDVYLGTNSVSAAIPNVTLTFDHVGTSPSTVIAQRDASATLKNLQSFVSQFNDAHLYWSTNAKGDPSQGIRGVLFGEGTSRSAIEGLGSLISQQYYSTGTTRSLADVGITTNRDGTLAIDTSKATAAIAADPAGVEKIFTAEDGVGTAVSARIRDAYVDSAHGTFTSTKNSLDASMRDTQDRIETLDARITARSKNLRDQFTRMELALSRIQTMQSYFNAMLGTSSTSTTTSTKSAS